MDNLGKYFIDNIVYIILDYSMELVYKHEYNDISVLSSSITIYKFDNIRKIIFIQTIIGGDEKYLKNIKPRCNSIISATFDIDECENGHFKETITLRIKVNLQPAPENTFIIY
jgi:hypothetical protein